MTRPRDEILVIGAGVVGLTTALELLQRAQRVRVLARQTDRPPASSVAPALFTPYPGPAPERLRRWTERALARWRALAADEPESGVTMGTLREYCYAPRRTEPWMDALLRTKPLPRRPPFAEIADSLRPHIDMSRFMPWLRARIGALGGAIEAREIHSLDALAAAGARRIVNCSGLGARALAADPLVRPMHGQVLHVPNDIGLDYSVHDDAPAGRGGSGGVAYVFRYADRLVVGGTFEDNREDSTTDQPALTAILERARNLLRADGHPRWNDLGRTILETRAAPRPARGQGATYEDIRLEANTHSTGHRIIHNYGHGRMGVTLAWGTAEEAAQLVMQE